MFVKLVASTYSLLTLFYVATATKTFLLEAEGGATTGEVRMRGSASSGASIYLKHGEFISYGLTTDRECSIVVLGVRYSEGSTVDTATVSIDGQRVGSFHTIVNNNIDDPWNHFYDSGQIGDQTTLAAGEHTLKIAVSTTDEYGMEVDYIQLNTTCDITTYANEDSTEDTATTQDSKTTYGGATTAPAESNPIDDTSEEPSEGSKNTSESRLGEIIGIPVGIVIATTAVITIVLKLVSMHKKRRRDRTVSSDPLIVKS